MPEKIEKMFMPFKEKMIREGIPQIVIENFRFYYNKLVEGDSGMITESEIERVKKLANLQDLSQEYHVIGQENLFKTVILKLNGGLGTSMGMTKAKSLLKVKDNDSFLDIIAKQAIQKKMPLLLMNSFSTQSDSLIKLEEHPELDNSLPRDFLQHKIPKIVQSNFQPVSWPENPELEWCPPGHGDLYLALITSGILEKLLQQNFRYMFVSNADNLGAVVDEKLLGYLIKNKLPFLLETAERTESDKKGGHLAQLKNGQLILREIAQCPDEDLDAFQDVSKHKYFNTNSIWIDLKELKKLMERKNNLLKLPMIRNKKTVDPRDKSSTPVFQLETAMGSAISTFKNSGAICVPRTRFAPVKATSDLLAVRSDFYSLTGDYRIIPNPERKSDKITIALDAKYYKMIDDFDSRFSSGPPSLKNCSNLSIQGDFNFGQNISLKNSVSLINKTSDQIDLKDDSVLEGEHSF